uniref:Uncharacterized protein n=1 Tax=Brassica oleracea TaxID=3712 RepID=A0A3P6B3H6_BRAOL|nr:unnamed protein product [Brassica oleracea]
MNTSATSSESRDFIAPTCPKPTEIRHQLPPTVATNKIVPRPQNASSGRIRMPTPNPNHLKLFKNQTATKVYEITCNHSLKTARRVTGQTRNAPPRTAIP